MSTTFTVSSYNLNDDTFNLTQDFEKEVENKFWVDLDDFTMPALLVAGMCGGSFNEPEDMIGQKVVFILP